MPKQKRKILKWKFNDVPFSQNWTSEDFKIDFIESTGDGEGGEDGYLLIYGNREIEYFSKLSSAKKVAQLIHNG